MYRAASTSVEDHTWGELLQFSQKSAFICIASSKLIIRL